MFKKSAFLALLLAALMLSVSPLIYAAAAPPATPGTQAPGTQAPATPGMQAPGTQTPGTPGVQAPGTQTPGTPGVQPPGTTGSTMQDHAGHAKVNINTASAAELEKLSGIGPKTAQEIIKYREANGPFKSVDDLKKVKGVGDKNFETNKNMITVE